MVAPTPSTAITKAAAPAVISLREWRMLTALHRSRRLDAAFIGSCLAGGNLKGLAFQGRDDRSSLNRLNIFDGRS